jgi:hypothetical protein
MGWKTSEGNSTTGEIPIQGARSCPEGFPIDGTVIFAVQVADRENESKE